MNKVITFALHALNFANNGFTEAEMINDMAAEKIEMAEQEKEELGNTELAFRN